MDKESVLYRKCYSLLLEPVTWIFGGVKDQIQIPEKTLLTAMEKHSLCVSIVSLSLDSNVVSVQIHGLNYFTWFCYENVYFYSQAPFEINADIYILMIVKQIITTDNPPF